MRWQKQTVDQAVQQSLRCRTHVAYIIHTLGMGGAERVAVMLANRLDRERFRPSIVCLNRNNGVACWGLAEDVPIFEVRKRRGNDIRAPFRLARLLRENRCDVVHSNNWGTLVETALARRWAGVSRHVHVEHGLELHDLRVSLPRRTARRWLMRWALGRTDAVVAVCDDVAERLHRRSGYPKHRIITMLNGVEVPDCADRPAARHRVRTALGIGPDPIVVGSVGRLAPVKDFGNAIDAVARLIGQGADVHLLLVSDGPEREALSARATNHNLADRVHLVGHQDELGPCLAAMDVFVNSSLSEGMSISILEAMGFGLPLVVTDVGQSAVLVGGDDPCGLVVPPGRCDALADAIAQQIRSPRLRQCFSASARRRHAAHYSVGQMVQSYQRLYTEGSLTASQSPAPSVDCAVAVEAGQSKP